MNRTKTKLLAAISIIAVFVSLVVVAVPKPAQADQYDAQISALKKQIQQSQDSANQKHAEADTLKNKIAQIQDQINAAQAALNLTKLQVSQTNQQIDVANKELDKQKGILKDNLRILYKQGEISPLEVVASSKNLSDFVANQEYLGAIKKKVDDNVAKIDKLQKELATKKDQLTNLQSQQQAQADNVAAQQAQQQQLLAQTQGDESKYRQQITDANAAIQALQKQRAINLAAQSNIRSGGSDGYPWAGTDQAWWNCAARGGWYNCGDEMSDGQSYYTRQCTSYVAWKINQVHGYLPRNFGMAQQWPYSAQARGISTSFGSGARQGDAAVLTGGSTGHVMYVKDVYPDGSFDVSQYNANWTGEYSTGHFNSQSGVWFIHF